MLKFLQTLALDFRYICLQFFTGNFSRQEEKFYRQMYSKILKSGSSVYNSVFFSSVCNSMPSKFFVRVVRSGALVYNSYFFQNRRFTKIIRH